MKKIVIILLSFFIIFTSSVFAEDVSDDLTTPSEDFPSYYNAVEEGWVTPVQFQNPWNLCWAFASTAASETNVLKKGGSLEKTKFSEKALAYFMYNLQGSMTTPVNDREGAYLTSGTGALITTLPYMMGGTALMPPGQMMSWNGLSSYAQVPFRNSTLDVRPYTENIFQASPLGNWSLNYGEIFNQYYHTNEIYANCFIDNYGNRLVEKEEEISTIKTQLLEFGGLFIMCNIEQMSEEGELYPYIDTENWAQYEPEYIAPDHAMEIVGYDDNYPISNFKEGKQPSAPGAWLIKNSWATTFGNEGYYWISYYDESIATILSFDADTAEIGYKYDNNYQYDYLGLKSNQLNYFIYKLIDASDKPGDNYENKYSFANRFTAKGDEVLRAVTGSLVYPSDEATITAQVYVRKNGDSNWNLTNELTNSYHYITGTVEMELENPVNLNKGDEFVVVETLNYYNMKLLPDFSLTVDVFSDYNLEVATEGYSVLNATDAFNVSVGEAYEYSDATVYPGESYIKGVNTNPDQWFDVTDPLIKDDIAIPMFNTNQMTGETMETVAEPGNMMIKAFTTDMEEPVDTEISLDSRIIYLSSNANTTKRTATITANLTPADSDVEVIWESEFPTVARVIPNGNQATIVAMAEGETTITAMLSNGNYASVEVIVNNNLAITESVEIVSKTPDYYTINVINPGLNPLVQSDVSAVAKVSIFTWSADDMSDLDCKVANFVNGKYTYTFPVNNNAVNEYYDKADDIYINIYVSLNSDNDGNLVTAGYYNWFNYYNSNNSNTAYITYNQNIGFKQPTVFNNQMAGEIDNPASKHIEGVRISSQYYDYASIMTQVYEEGIGWTDPVLDGEYAGTMHQNRALESIKLTLYGQYSNLFNLNYRVYQNGSWTDWVSEGQEAGIAGQNLPIQAIQIDMQNK